MVEYEAAESAARKSKPVVKSKPPVDKGPSQEPTDPPKPKPAVPANPDEADQAGEPVKEELIEAPDAKTAAWASFCQALLGSAEFRYLQ